jgi:hypothetical protein
VSAKLQPEWIERRANIDPETGARQKRLLVIGINAAQIAGAFAKLMPNCHIEAATRADNAVMAMASGHFDATLVDCRDDERFHRLAVVAARQFKEGRVALLASDHFLPDEKAVLDNLEIFGSQDDSAKLLASLRLKARPPVRKKPAQETADFETALRAELEALQSKAGPAPAQAKAAQPDQTHAEAVGAPSAAPLASEALTVLEPVVLAAPADPDIDGSIDLQAIENTSQLSLNGASALLEALALELEDIQLSEALSGELQNALDEKHLETDGKAPDAGTLDLFGNPLTEPRDLQILESAEAEPDMAESPDAGDLLSWVAPEPRAPKSPAAPPADWDQFDLFGFALIEIREKPSFETAPVQEDFSGNLNLFDVAARQPVELPASSEPASNKANEDQKTSGISEFYEAKSSIGEFAQPSTKTSLLRSTSWLAHLLPRLTPVYSLVYKNLALVILGALFTAFVAFGVMITFFLTSNKWSAPITLSRGHELVIKVERELSDLNVRKNQISEQIDDAGKNLQSSRDQMDRARSLAGMIEGTITAEIKNRGEIRAEIEKHTEALRKVAAQYGNDTLNPQFKGNLAREFDRRLINRNIFEAGKLAQLEAAHRTALIRNEIAANEVEISRLNSTLAALGALSGHVEGTAAPVAGAGGADLVPLLNQVIEVRKGSSEAASELKAAESRGALLSDSLRTVESSIAQIETTPLARAISENITVLFVPYENASQYQKGNSLYSCAIGIFFCSQAGKVGNVIEGETVATHPFFNKPVRGSFVEAELANPDAARKEILHVKRRPLFF